MQLQELQKFINIAIAESLEERFMDSEELYVRFLRKLEAANELVAVEQLIEQENWPEALRKAHNLKGVCGSLGLITLQDNLAELVKLLRTEGFTKEQAQTMLAVIKPEWEKTLACIRELE